MIQLLRMVAADAQEVLQVVPVDGDSLCLGSHQLHGRLPAHRRQLPLEQANAGLSGVAGDDLTDRPIGDPQTAAVEAVALHLTGQQMPPGNLQFLLIGVAAQLDDLHTIQQRTGDGAQVVGGGDEHHIGQVEGQL